MFKDKYALVTGGSSGIGRAIALKLAAQGAHIAILSTHRERASSLLSDLEKEKAFPHQSFLSELVDVSSKAAVDLAAASIEKRWGRSVDILINNAGITRDNLLMKMDEKEWDEVIAVNLKSLYNVSKAFIRPMIRARSGKIVNLSSIVGLHGNPGQVNYAAAKGGVIAFTKALAKEVALRGISVNCIAPGFIETAMTAKLTDTQRENMLKAIPLGRFGAPEEVAHLALFLASSQSDYITGQVFTIDGGMSI